jgi:CheY-like chemotaxis protein
VATVLIVEDQAQVLVLAQSLLEEQGYRTLSAATPDDALAILTGREAVDALFVDIILNGNMQAGIELAKRAVELKPGLKVVYSTGLAVTDDLKALLVPGSVILEKPYTVDHRVHKQVRNIERSPWRRWTETLQRSQRFRSLRDHRREIMTVPIAPITATICLLRAFRVAP